MYTGLLCAKLVLGNNAFKIERDVKEERPGLSRMPRWNCRCCSQMWSHRWPSRQVWPALVALGPCPPFLRQPDTGGFARNPMLVRGPVREPILYKPVAPNLPGPHEPPASGFSELGLQVRTTEPVPGLAERGSLVAMAYRKARWLYLHSDLCIPSPLFTLDCRKWLDRTELKRHRKQWKRCEKVFFIMYVVLAIFVKR